MATYIQNLAYMSDHLYVAAQSADANNRRLVPKHVESLKPYLPGRPPEQLKKELGIEKFINMASNENPLGPPKGAAAAIANAISEVNRYPEFGGLRLRKALADQYAVSEHNVAIGNGSESIMANIVRAFLHDDDEVLTSEGTFIGFPVIVQAQGVKLNQVPLKNYAFDLDGIADAVNKKTKIIYLCNPNNPTGTIFTRPEFERFMDKIPEHVLVLLDEAYYEFAIDNPLFPDSMIYRFDNVLTLRTFSKAYAMAGLRLGFGLGHQYLIDYVNRIKLPFEPNCLAQAAGLAALYDPDFLDRTLANNKVGMSYLTEEFDKMGLHRVPSFGNFIMSDLHSAEEVTRVHEGLLRQGIAIRPLHAFGLPTCIRVTIGLPEENLNFIRALKKVL